MISPQIDDIGPSLVDFLQNKADKAGVLARPAALAPEGPAVDDIAVEDEALGLSVFQEVVDFIDLAIGGAEVDVREKDRLEPENGLFGIFSISCEFWMSGDTSEI
jgi:hypothetical protein